jgi:hypothetical protein
MGLDVSSIKPIAEQVICSKGKLTYEYLFTIKAASILFYKNSISSSDIKSNFTDGTSDGGIDFIYTDSSTMYLIQGKSTDKLTSKDILAEVTTIKKTIKDFDDDREGRYSTQLIQTYRNSYDLLDDNKNIEINIVTNTIFDKEALNKINLDIEQSIGSDYKVVIYDLNSLEELEASINTNGELVPQGEIEIDKASNLLMYDEGGFIVNVKASSLKRLYQKFGKQGLFSYNLREYIKQQSVDDAIKATINDPKERINFWYFNNGITIGCEDYIIDGNKIKLYGFSIINGAQTTTKIGESSQVSQNTDFYLSCKVIKALSDDKIEGRFIQKVSEASNSQKPIKPRDLKANAPEQQLLQDKALRNNNKLAIEIKRGVKPKTQTRLDKWQRVTNEYLGQLIYAALLQHPGPARSNKRVLFSSNKIYNQIFKNIKHDYDTLYDLVKLADLYKEYLNRKANNLPNNIDDINAQNRHEEYGIADNGKLAVIATILYLLKKKRGIIIDASDKGLLCDNNISGLFMSSYREDDFEKRLFELFDLIVETITDCYNRNKVDLKVTSYSNFFKTDKVYHDVILVAFDNLRDRTKKELEDLMIIFT